MVKGKMTKAAETRDAAVRYLESGDWGMGSFLLVLFLEMICAIVFKRSFSYFGEIAHLPHFSGISGAMINVANFRNGYSHKGFVPRLKLVQSVLKTANDVLRMIGAKKVSVNLGVSLITRTPEDYYNMGDYPAFIIAKAREFEVTARKKLYIPADSNFRDSLVKAVGFFPDPQSVMDDLADLNEIRCQAEHQYRGLKEDADFFATLVGGLLSKISSPVRLR